MKGFVRILETIIAAIIILTALSFFLPITIKQSGWDSTIAAARAQDALNVGYRSGTIAPYVKNNDNANLRSFLETLFSKSTDFSVEINGIPNSIIYLGCASCTDSQISDLQGRLIPTIFAYKGRTIEMRTDKVTAANIPDETNILLYMNFADLNNDYNNNNTKNSIERFVEGGGTLFLLDDLTSAQSNTDVIRNLFKLSWSTQSNPQNRGGLDGFDDPERITYNVARYYETISGNQAKNANFGKFDIDGENLNKITASYRTIILNQKNDFSLVVGDKNVINGNGRTVWFAENDKSPDIKDLTKAAVLWASGEKYKMDGAVKKVPPKMNQKASVIIQDGDPYEFKITIWNVF